MVEKDFTWFDPEDIKSLKKEIESNQENVTKVIGFNPEMAMIIIQLKRLTNAVNSVSEILQGMSYKMK